MMQKRKALTLLRSQGWMALLLSAAVLLSGHAANAQESAHGGRKVYPQNPDKRASSIAGRVLFARAADVTDETRAAELVEKCRQAGFNTLILQVKEPDGTVYFDTLKFMGARALPTGNFDPLKVVLNEAKKCGLLVHAGFCAFLEGADSYIAKAHPEWAALTPEGKNTSMSGETIGMWMCPARRPGYADEYLIPMIEELLKKYDVDGIHLDRLSFPTCSNPDSFCFCDYCVKNFPRASRLYYPSEPKKRFEQPAGGADAPSQWHKGWSALPRDYDSFSRKVKSEYMLKGRYHKSGPGDIDCFFYSYRTDAIRKSLLE